MKKLNTKQAKILQVNFFVSQSIREEKLYSLLKHPGAHKSNYLSLADAAIGSRVTDLIRSRQLQNNT